MTFFQRQMVDSVNYDLDDAETDDKEEGFAFQP